MKTLNANFRCSVFNSLECSVCSCNFMPFICSEKLQFFTEILFQRKSVHGIGHDKFWIKVCSDKNSTSLKWQNNWKIHVFVDRVNGFQSGAALYCRLWNQYLMVHII